MSRPKKYPDFKAYRREYNKTPEAKAKQRLYSQKYRQKPDVAIRLKEYNREYMKNYWRTHPEKYKVFKVRVAELNKMREQNVEATSN